MKTDIFKQKQDYALAHPCRYAMDCLAPKYYHVQHDKKDIYSIGLTVNVGEE